MDALRDGLYENEDDGTGPGDPSDDGFLMTSGLKNASKCRSCSKTLDVGTPAWFNKEGEPGRKVTCQECHKAKYGDAPAGGEDGEKVAIEKTTKKKKRVVPKFTPDLLCDREKGLVSIFKSFPKLKFRGKGHEAADLRRLLAKYQEWANILVPEMELGDFITRLEKGSNHRVRTKLELIRNVQQGLCTLEDIDDYELADKAHYDRAANDDAAGVPDWMEDDDFGADWDGGGFDADGATTGAPAAAGQAAAELSDEQRERMERNKRLALEKAAARKAAGGGAAAAARAAATEEEEMMAMEMEAGGMAGGGRRDDDELNAFDEEAEDDFFFDSFPAPRAAGPVAAPSQAAAPPPRPRDQFDEFDEEAEAQMAAFDAGAEPADAAAADSPPPDAFTFRDPAEQTIPTVSESQPTFAPVEEELTFREPQEESTEEAQSAARAAARAAAEALEADFDDDDE
jgi:hypothetical protein